MLESTLLRDLSVVMVVAALTTTLARLLKQPVVIGYLIAGLLIGPHTPPFSLVRDAHSIHTMAELGLVFLMFSLGLEFNLAKVKRVGFSAGLAAVIKILGTTAIGYGVARALEWKTTDAIFLGAILAISSTTIIVKIFSDLSLLKEEFAEVVFGILILEDVVAVIILTLLSGLSHRGESQGLAALRTLGEVSFFVVLFLVLGLILVPRLMHRLKKFKSAEMLGITALGLCLAGALLAYRFGYSVALGAFLMGSVIGVSSAIDVVEEWIHPIRDMFSAIFFVSAGLLIEPRILWDYKGAILLITVATILGKIVSGTAGSFLAGYRFPFSIRVGMSLAQIGEFSFVIANLGIQTRLANEALYPLTVAVSAITTLFTPYLIRNSDAVSQTVLRWGGPSLTKQLDRCHHRLEKLRGPSSDEATIFSRYLVRLALYVALYIASASLAVFLAGQFIPRQHYWQTVYWTIAATLALPIFLGIARYASHFLLLATTQLLVKLRAFSVIQRVPINTLYQAFERLTVCALSGLFLWQGLPYLSHVAALITAMGVVTLAPWIAQRGLESAYRTTERLLDEAVGLASSEPLRRATLEVGNAHGALNESISRIWIGSKASASNHTIRSLGLREKSGASIIGLYRGGRLTVNPSPELTLLPQDVIVVLGNEEQKDRARALLE